MAAEIPAVVEEGCFIWKLRYSRDARPLVKDIIQSWKNLIKVLEMIEKDTYGGSGHIAYELADMSRTVEGEEVCLTLRARPFLTRKGVRRNQKAEAKEGE